MTSLADPSNLGTFRLMLTDLLLVVELLPVLLSEADIRQSGTVSRWNSNPSAPGCVALVIRLAHLVFPFAVHQMQDSDRVNRIGVHLRLHQRSGWSSPTSKPAEKSMLSKCCGRVQSKVQY